MPAAIRKDGFISRLVYALIFLTVIAITQAFSIPNSRAASGQSTWDDLGIVWIEVEAGTLTVGSGSNAQQISIDRFLISATEVTFDQYDAFCDATGKQKPDDNGWGRGTRPVLNVSYDDAVEFCQWLSRVTGSAVRLPNEAEWEYAARGGRHSKGYTHSGGNNKNDVSWNEDNSGNQTHPVGTKKPNELGIFDMSGNLWEWCADWPGTSDGEAQIEPEVSGTGGKCILRGDSFDNPGTSDGYKLSVRLYRGSRHINIGFRIARSD